MNPNFVYCSKEMVAISYENKSSLLITDGNIFSESNSAIMK